jgi:hypothetical protein
MNKYRYDKGKHLYLFATRAHIQQHMRKDILHITKKNGKALCLHLGEGHIEKPLH